ncbi:hypothetical protein DXZ75_41780 [Streptomyces sp. AcE210]|nr:hypothetical protein DXZ75_41780 [Streptomyces sp. AcE210]
MSQLEDEQHGLSGGAADPLPPGGLDGFGEGTFCVTVVPLDAVAQLEVDLLPLLAPVLEGLPVLGPFDGNQGDAALVADLERPCGARLRVDERQLDASAHGQALDGALDLAGLCGTHHTLMPLAVLVLLGH